VELLVYGSLVAQAIKMCSSVACLNELCIVVAFAVVVFWLLLLCHYKKPCNIHRRECNTPTTEQQQQHQQRQQQQKQLMYIKLRARNTSAGEELSASV